jgi:hypothetical protein
MERNREESLTSVARRFFWMAVVAVVCWVGLLVASGVANAASALDQQEPINEGAVGVGTEPGGQTVTAGLSGTLDHVELDLGKNALAEPTLPLNVEIRNVEAGGEPGTTVLASSTVPASSVTTTEAWVPIVFALPAHVEAGKRYAIVFYTLGAGQYAEGIGNGNPYPAGSSWYSMTRPPTAWTSFSSVGAYTFKTYVTVAPLPTFRAQCRNGGWKNFGTKFKNHGQCVKFVITHG